MNKSTFEEELERHGKLFYTNVGDSMKPLLRERRDLLIIERPAGRLKKYDVPFYKRDSGQYVLHCIVKVRENDYVICGDNRYNLEFGITEPDNRGSDWICTGRQDIFSDRPGIPPVRQNMVCAVLSVYGSTKGKSVDPPRNKKLKGKRHE